MTAYYNDNDPAACAWLRALIDEGLLPAGVVDERPIQEIEPHDLKGFTECHFFAGIGGWPLALRWAGWAAGRPVWTGSVPCQPFSVAGKGLGTDDERHLWPEFRRLIHERRPAAVFGEQVSGAAGQAWLARVFADLEVEGYRVAGADLPACAVGAPHRRQRLYWVADAENADGRGRASRGNGEETGNGGGLGGASEPGLEGHAGHESDRDEPGRQRTEATGPVAAAGGNSGLSDAEHGRRGADEPQREPERRATDRGYSPWDGAIWLPCADGKARRIKPGLKPLAHGVSGRVVVVRPTFGTAAEIQNEPRWVNRIAALRGAGNAIVPQLAAEFIRAYLEATK